MSSSPADRLYHYQKWEPEWLRKAVVERKIRFSGPENFNDPWDCRPFFKLDLSHPEARRREIDWIMATNRKHNTTWSEDRHQALAERLNSDVEFLRRTILTMSDQLDGGIREKYRIYCLCPSGTNALIWAHYAEKHRGIALEFDRYSETMQGAMPIEYSEFYPDMTLADRDDGLEILRPLLSKSDVWSYEHEVRLIALERRMAVSPGDDEIFKVDDGFFVLPEGVLTGVVLGCLVEEGTVDQARKIVALAGGKVALRKTERLRDRYDLRIVDI